ncbi:hypothetical protein GZH46_00254 [Fragariocoptes setiger]|uniref:Uncharacterized protein n=1 Tax=Fragariocoptes setiger TaxID=1670756 RepID=A0ABQ7SCR3_9ACAR|nr:hypothetical protein GZH46_00254 [Fragariocoptes setiger]
MSQAPKPKVNGHHAVLGPKGIAALAVATLFSYYLYTTHRGPGGDKYTSSQISQHIKSATETMSPEASKIVDKAIDHAADKIKKSISGGK